MGRPTKLHSLYDLGVAIKRGISRNDLTIVAAGVAFFGFLALVPALAAMIFFYGLFADPAAARAQVEALRDVFPEEATDVLASELDRLLTGRPQSLGLGALTSILVTLWSASKGSRALMGALNIVYQVRGGRGFLRSQAAALGMTLASILVVVVALGLLVVLPLVFQWLGLGAWQRVIEFLRWPILLGVALFGLGALYRYAPERPKGRAPTRWLSAGAMVATLLWLAASFLFTVYVDRVAGFSAAFGSIGAVIVLLFWLYISAFVILLGGTLNAEIERRRETPPGPAEAG